jgi:phosphoribosylamine--glycine ligase
VKFLIVSESGDGIGLATRLMAEGNEVRIWIRDNEAVKRGQGLVERATDYEFGEVIVADCTGSGPWLDLLRDGGRAVVGGSSIADRLETDRKFATGVMKNAGIKVPMSKSFKDWEKAIEFVRQADESVRFVFKPDGNLSGVIPSQVTRSNEELLESIEHFKHLVGQHDPEFTLQEFVEGTAISTEGWFDGREWVGRFNHTIERKHFLVGDLGPSGGCTGNLVWACDDDDPMVVAGIAKVTEFLAHHKYKGAIDLNAVVNDEGLYGLEFTPRFGYDAFPTFLSALYVGEIGELLYKIATDDQGPADMDLVDGFGAGVRVSVPPWPTEKYHAEEGVPIRGLRQGDLDWFYGYDIESRDSDFFTSGGYGIVGVVNAFGETVEEAFAGAYKRVKKIHLADMQYRTDLSEVILKDFKKVHRLVREMV